MNTSSLSIGITCYPTFGGSGVIATEIGKGMAQRGHRVHFVCSDVPRRLDRFMENIFFHEVEVRDYPLFSYPPYSLSLASKMVEVATYEKLDLLHVHYAVPHATSAYLAKQVLGEIAPKIITTLHGTDITLVGNERSYLPITRFSIFESDGVTAPSQYLKHATYDKLNLSTRTPIEVIPNFVDIDHFSPSDPKQQSPMKTLIGACPIATNTKIISHVSNFRPVKRVEDVVRVFANVTKSVRSHLVLVGDGPDRSAVEALVRELQITDKVCFLGKQDSFVQVLQNSDLFLLPSESESFGLAALEALACGVPVIASDVHGIPEVVQHGEDGLLAPVGDIEQFTAHTLALLKDDARRKRMSATARKHAVEDFKREDILDRYEEYYWQILRAG